MFTSATTSLATQLGAGFLAFVATAATFLFTAPVDLVCAATRYFESRRHMNRIATRSDHRETLFGVCAAIGDATGIPPIVLRLGLVAAILCGAFTLTVVGYCVAGLAIRLAHR